MSNSILDSVLGSLDSSFISQVASKFGEDEKGISSIVKAAVPTLLTGLIKSSSRDQGSNLLSMAKMAANSGVLNNIGSLLDDSPSSKTSSMGASLLEGLLGSKTDPMTKLLSGYTGAKSSTILSVLKMVAPIILGYIGKHALSNNLSGQGLLGWLTGQKNQIASAVPQGLSFGNLFDDDVAKFANQMSTKAATAIPERKNNWLWPLILLLLGAGLIWLLMRGCNPAKDELVSTVTTIVPAEAEKAVQKVVESFKVNLPDGIELNGFRGGIEDQLIAFLNNPSSQPGKDVWFDFDNLNFETGSARITPESQAQINNIAAILKAFPKTQIKIGGYTDVTGGKDANMKLSQDRADAVVSALKSINVNPSQLLGGEGYGSQFAKAAADAPESEKMKDRRISVSVRAK